ncbi:MAG: FimV/HubP family polar landmark protein [Gammaproteobacteria bacterium]
MMRKASAVLTAICCLAVSQVYALGLGTLSLESSLNQPLRARIEVVDLGGVSPAEITVQMAAQQDFERFDLERSNFLSGVNFEIERTADGVFVVLTSSQAVREPFLSFILDTRWPSGRILSEHTVLLDLPVFSDGQSVAQPINQPVSPVVEPQQGVVQRESAASRQVEQIADSSSPTATRIEEAAPEPQRDTAAPAPRNEQVISETPSRPESLEIQSSDTLWEIAMRVRPGETVSIQQTMLAIQRMNPDAFVDGNINRLQAGATLQIPDLSEIRSINQQQAVSEVSRQNQQADLNAQPLTAPGTGPSSLTSADRQGQLRVLTAEDAEPSASGGSAALEAENSQLDARIAALENQLALQEEEADRVGVQRAELLSRLNDLDEQIASAMAIIRLQDQQLAQLQQSLVEAAAQASAQPQSEPQEQPPATASAQPLQTTPPSFRDSVVRVLSSSSTVLVVVVLLVVLLTVMLLMRRNRAAAAEGLEEGLADDLGPEKDDTVLLRNAVPGSGIDDELGAEKHELPQAAALAGAGLAGAAMSGYGDADKSEQEYDEEFGGFDEIDEVSEETLGDVWDDDEPDDSVDELTYSGADSTAAGQDSEAELPLNGLEESTSELDDDEVIDFELDHDAEQAGAVEEDVDVMDFDIDDFLDEEDDQPGDGGATPAAVDSNEAESADSDAGIDFELDTEIGDVGESDSGETDHGGGIDFTTDAGRDEGLAEAEVDNDGAEEVRTPLDDGSEDDELETLDFDLSSEGIDAFDQPDNEAEISDLATKTETEVESLNFSLSDAPEEGDSDSEELYELDSATADPESEQRSVDFALTEEDAVDVGEEGEDGEVDAIDFELDDSGSDSTSDIELDLDSEHEAAPSVADIELDLDHQEETAREDIEVDLDYEEEQTRQDFDIEFEDPSEADQNSEAASGSAPESEAREEVLVDLASEEADLSESDEQLEDQTTTVEYAAENDSEITLEAASQNEATGIDLSSEAAANDQGQPGANEDSRSADAVVADNRQDEEAATPEAAVELGDLDFFSADKESALEGAEDDLEFLSDDDEAATKLDLAYAYQKMGDVDGAKEILEEVISEGNDSQISEARNLMQALQK